MFEREAVEGENEFEEAEAGLLHSASTGGAWKFDRPAGVGWGAVELLALNAAAVARNRDGFADRSVDS